MRLGEARLRNNENIRVNEVRSIKNEAWSTKRGKWGQALES